MNKLSEDSEIIAMRSFGLKKSQLIMPLLILGTFLSLTIFMANKKIIPYSKRQFKNTIIKLTSKGMLTDIKEGNFYTEIPNITLFAEKVRKGGKILSNVFIHLKDSKTKELKIIFAKSGVLIKRKQVDEIIPSLRLHLEDGNITRIIHGKEDMEKIIFKKYDFPLINSNFRLGFVTKDSMRTNTQLLDVMKKNRKEYEQLIKVEISKRNSRRINDLKKDYIKSKLEYWARYNTPIQCIVFILLGFTFGIKKGRGKNKNTGGIVMLMLVLYYAILFLGISMAKKGQVPPVITIFTPSILITWIGLKYYKKLDWIS